MPNRVRPDWAQKSGTTSNFQGIAQDTGSSLNFQTVAAPLAAKPAQATATASGGNISSAQVSKPSK